MPTNHVMYHIRYQVVTGNLQVGFSFYGTFDKKTEARRWAMAHLTAEEIVTHTIQDIQTIPEDWG